MERQGDTIAAIATPAGPGAIGIVRLSGARAIDIACAVLRRSPETLPDRMLVAGVVHDADGARVDQVLAVAMRGPRSYTGEDVVEVHGHGGTVNCARLLREVVAAGARLAEPGEFTRRAFANEKIDLTHAEAVAALIASRSERAARVAQRQLAGQVGAVVREWKQRVVSALADCEAELDFPEEGNAFPPVEATLGAIGDLHAEITRWSAGFGLGKVLRDGIEVVLAGPSNVGKSSIFNALLGQERTVVAPEPGTTRDYVEALTEWEGAPVLLVDTAGQRASDSVAERRGIALGETRARTADVVVMVEAADSSPEGWPTPHPTSGRLYVLNKIDLVGGVVPSAPADGWIGTSIVTGVGIPELRRAILRAGGFGGSSDDDHDDDIVVVTSERQRGLLEATLRHLEAAAAARRAGAPLEILTLEVRAAAGALGHMLGEGVTGEVLDALFARFCIGK